MNHVSRTSQCLALLTGVVALAACSHSSSSAPSGPSAETTAAKVESERADLLDRLDQSAALVRQLREKIPDGVAASAQCLVIVPSLVKGGVVVGAEVGKGYATCQIPSGWSAPAPISVGGGTLGAQLGVQTTELVAIVTTPKAMKALASGNFRVGVDASATAGPVGTGRGTSTDIPANSDLFSYSRSKGLFAGANLNGSSIKADNDAIGVLYGPGHNVNEILDGRVHPISAPASERFLSAVRTSYGRAALPSVSSTAP